jgi:hypothetical protein
MRANILLVTLIVVFFTQIDNTSDGYAQQNELPNIMSLQNENAMPEATVSDVSWIEGHWKGEMFGGIGEEIWSPPFANSMMGMYKLVVDDSVSFYELMIIIEESNSLALKLKHFSSDLTSWEEKNEFVSFPLVKCTHNEAYFDGLTFKLIDDSTLQVYLRMKHGEDGIREIPFQYHRVTH